MSVRIKWEVKEMGSKKGIPHRKWTREEKLELVKLHLNEHISILEIERRYGVTHQLISAWTKKYLDEGEDALEPRKGNPYAALHTSKSLNEVERLRLIVAKQEVEIARLKKGYWVEGVGVNKEYVTGSKKNTKSSKNSK
jgi:transposase-like protein